MESYSSSYSSSSNKSAYSTRHPEKAKVQKHAYRFQSHNYLLHSVRKAKQMKKAPVAPMPQTPAKEYKVDPLNFRELVQKLTGAPEFKPRQHLQHHQILHNVKGDDVTSLDVASHHPIQDMSSRNIAAASPPMHTNWYQDLQSELFGLETQENATEGAMAPGFLDVKNLSSPSCYSNWCNFFPLLSPGT